MINKIARLLGADSDFALLFFGNEYRALAGKNNRTIKILIGILFLTFLALGFAVGGIQNLREKMDNPFTNWVNLNITSNFQGEKARNAEEDYLSAEKKERFSIADVRGWSQVNLQLYHQDYNPCRFGADTLLYSVWGRILEPDDPLSRTVLSRDNQLWTSESFNDRNFVEEGLADCEIIISEKALIRLGYDPKEEDIGHIFTEEEGVPIALQIVGVVKELPRFCEFICAPRLFNVMVAKRDVYRGTTKYCNDLVVRNEEGENIFNFVTEADADMAAVKSLATSFWQLSTPPQVRIASTFKSGENEWALGEIAFLPIERPTLDSFQLFKSYVRQEGLFLGDINQIECEGIDYCGEVNFEDYHYLAFNFNRLYDIRNFQADLREVHKVDVDMSQVEAKENFALVGWLTWVISLILLFFGVLSIILFVNNLLSSHLYRVRTNLGTFKAFGLSDQFLNKIYIKIILYFLFIAISIAFIGAMVVDRMEQLMAGEESKFNIFSFEIFLAVLVLVLVSTFISSKTIQKILGDTPGNLIYGR